MKRIISFMMLFAAAMALSSCQKQETDALEMDKVEGLNFSAEKPKLDDESRTEWTGETIQWSKGDAIRVAYTCDGVWQNADATATREEEDGKRFLLSSFAPFSKKGIWLFMTNTTAN